MSVLVLPEPSLIVLIGAAGSGKSTFAARHFTPDEVLSSDALRAAIAGDPTDQSVTGAAFAALHAAVDRRLRTGRLTVVDATNLMPSARRTLVKRAAAAGGVPSTAIVLDLEPAVVLVRNAARSERVVPEDVVRRHLVEMRRLMDGHALDLDGFARIVVLRDQRDIDAIQIRRATEG
jgi:protein phosphatase